MKTNEENINQNINTNNKQSTNSISLNDKGIIISFSGGNEYQEKLKNVIQQGYPNQINFLQISDIIRTINSNPKKQKTCKGIISSTWMKKISIIVPSMCIVISDISDLIVLGITNEEITQSIFEGIIQIKRQLINISIVLILIDTSTVSSKLNEIRNAILKMRLYGNIPIVNEQNIFLIYKKGDLHNEKFISRFRKGVLMEALAFYYQKIKGYEEKIKDGMDMLPLEQLAKLNIKVNYLSFLVHNEKKKYDYFQKAYDILTMQITCNNYSLNPNEDERIVYLEKKKACDWLFSQLLTNKSLKNNTLQQKILIHLGIFDCFNYLKIPKDKINLELIVLNLLWKIEIYQSTSVLMKKDQNSINIFSYFGELNSLIRLYQFEKEKRDDIKALLKYEDIISEEIEYIEKIPIYKDINDQKIYDVDTIINLYYNDVIKKIEFNFEDLRSRVINKLNEGLKCTNSIGGLTMKFNFIQYILTSGIFTEVQIEWFISDIIKNANIPLDKYSKFYIYILEKYKNILQKKQITSDIFKSQLSNLVQISSLHKLDSSEIEKLNTLLNSPLNDNKYNEINTNFVLNVPYNSIIKVESSFSDINPDVFEFVTFNIKLTLNFPLVLSISRIKLFTSNVERNSQISYSKGESFTNNKPIIIKVNFLSKHTDSYGLQLQQLIIELVNNIKLSIFIDIDKKENQILYIKKANSKKTPLNIFKVSKTENTIVGVGEYNYYHVTIEKRDNDKKFKDININSMYAAITINSTNVIERIPKNEFISSKNEKFYNQLILSSNIQLDLKNQIRFLLKLQEKGNFNIKVKISIKLSHALIPSEQVSYDLIEYINVNVQDSYEETQNIFSDLYMNSFTSFTEERIYPKNHIIKNNITLKNMLNYSMIISKIFCVTMNNNITIKSPLMKYLKMNNLIPPKCQYIIPLHILFNANIIGSPGECIIEWQSEEMLKNFPNIKNIIHLKLGQFNIQNVGIHIENKYTSENEYCLLIRNEENYLKKIIVNMRQEFEKNACDYLIDGVINKNVMLQPNESKELKYHIVPLMSQGEGLIKPYLIKIGIYPPERIKYQKPTLEIVTFAKVGAMYNKHN